MAVFFAELDDLLTEELQIHCCGGFLVINVYDIARTTNDLDFVGTVPNLRGDLTTIAGQGSPLHRKHGVYLHAVTIATPPENYQERLLPIHPATWRRLRLFALEAHDLALSKLEGNRERDRDDVQRLARAGHLRPDILRERYYRELRPNLTTSEDKHDLMLQLWLDSYWAGLPNLVAEIRHRLLTAHMKHSCDTRIRRLK